MPRGWTEVALGEVAEVVMGQSPPGNTYNSDGVGLPFIQGSAEFGARYPLPPRWCSEPRKVARRGDLLMSVRAPVGDLNFADNDLAIGRGLAIVRGNRHRAMTEYLALALEHAAPAMRRASGGTMFESINGAALRAQPILIPTLAEQRRIVDLIGSADALGGHCEEARDATQQAYEAFLDSAAQAADRRMTVRDCVRIAKSGGTPSRVEPGYYGGDIPWLKSGEVASDLIRTTAETITETGLRSSSAWLVPAGAVAVAMYGATAGAVGRTAIPLATNQAVLSLFSKPEIIEQGLLFHFLRWLSRDLKARAVGGAQPNLSKGRVLDAAVPVPAVTDQQRLTMLLDGLLEVRGHYDGLASEAATLRRALLGDLLSGDHEVSASYDRFLDGAA